MENELEKLMGAETLERGQKSLAAQVPTGSRQSAVLSAYKYIPTHSCNLLWTLGRGGCLSRGKDYGVGGLRTWKQVERNPSMSRLAPRMLVRKGKNEKKIIQPHLFPQPVQNMFIATVLLRALLL